MDVRLDTRKALINAWHASYQNTPEKTSLMLAFSNRDVDLLNEQARFFLKTSNHLDKHEFLYTLKKEGEDDFWKKCVVKIEKGFSKGDRIVFTRNNYDLGVKNGTMGTIVDLSPHKIRVELDHDQDKGGIIQKEGVTTKEKGKTTPQVISFAPKLYPYFDHGWAVTIHKSQGTTVGKAYVLASAEMNQNLTYVAMTHHREDVQVFASSLDFWREEKLPQMLSKSGEKLVAADYLDANSLEELMKKEDKLLSKIFTRISDELEAMGAVSKKVFWNVADHLLGIDRTSEIRIEAGSFSKGNLREEARAETLLQQTQPFRQRGAVMRHGRPLSEKKTPERSLFKAHTEKSGIPYRSFEELMKFCEERLYKVMEKEGNALTQKRKQRFSQQAEKTAAYLLHSHTLKGHIPTEKEISEASLRAKYELKRIPQIREEIIKGWKANNNFKENERILAHSIAEQRATIEWRLFLKAKKQGLKPPSDIASFAQKELKEHRFQTDSLAYKLAYTHSSSESALSSEAAQHCAKDIFRYMETHGEKPSETHISNIIQIAKILEHREYGDIYQSNNPHEIEYLRRHERDALLRKMSSPESLHECRDEVSHYLNHIDKIALPHDLYDGHDFNSDTNGLHPENRTGQMRKFSIYPSPMKKPY